MPYFAHRRLFLCLSSLLVSTASAVVEVSLSLSVPSNAPELSPSLLSFSIEGDRWTDWTGTTSKNQFLYNALDNLKTLTGVPPSIRIGGDSEDHTNFNPNVEFSEAIFPDFSTTVPYPEATNVTVGDGYYETARFLPSGMRITWGVNFGQDNLTAAFLTARSMAKAFSSPAMKDAGVTLDFVEIGNEADWYINNGARPSNWTSVDYTQEWTEFASNISETVGMSSTSHTKFFVGSFITSSNSTTGFSPQAIYAEGILDSEPGAFITTFSQHQYSGVFSEGDEDLLQELMTKENIRGNLSVHSTDIAVTHSRGLDYVLGEANSFANHGVSNVSNTAGAALWALDYTLFASQLGISHVFFHEGVGYKYNFIQPVELTRSILDGSALPEPVAPHVQPPYYAAIIIGEAIGNSNQTQAVELSIDNSRISGYAFYEHDVLVRAVVINSQAYMKAETTSRSSTHLDLGFLGESESRPTTVQVKRLAIGHADDDSGLTWGGQTYETNDARAQGELEIETMQVASGLDIAETEAVLLSFIY
ncbi:glycoside hydrolase family 79 protein [Guyanagaster necrorhizus]|uniref:Glycoside hydrolase family 79 protein n=1 Tax=Guyanagaster necrorhizus TaxID=856835 RepID=A0A9P7VUJ8_9AGAR|nr:glycoside hydrolase family 79 protein [Guyanagaster necrorhizus MCA 3950]KAG7446126.1 glycoside hydrolase family 79 protein [Guyanagaster necrorhizus MCA 3950]